MQHLELRNAAVEVPLGIEKTEDLESFSKWWSLGTWTCFVFVGVCFSLLFLLYGVF